MADKAVDADGEKAPLLGPTISAPSLQEPSAPPAYYEHVIAAHVAPHMPEVVKQQCRCPACTKLVNFSSATAHVNIGCPHCRHVFNAAAVARWPVGQIPPPPPGKRQATCPHCKTRLNYPESVGTFVCSTCRRHCAVSVTAIQAQRRRFIGVLIVGLILIGAGVGVTVGTYLSARDSVHGGFYVVMYGPIISGTLLLIRASVGLCTISGTLPLETYVA